MTTKSPAYIAAHLRRVLKDGGSAPHSVDVQRFFKEEVRSRGWYTDELRKLGRRFTKVLLNDGDLEYLVQVADLLFAGEILEEKALAVLLLETSTSQFTDKHFALYESWLDRVNTWADHDAVVYYLIAPMVLADPRRIKTVFSWAKSKHVWHRRAAAVALIRNARALQNFKEIERVTAMLVDDREDMVQKGLGWLLRESGKANPQQTVPLLMKIRDRASRLVLRTACEKLSESERRRVLDRTEARASRSSPRRLRGARAV